MVERDPDFHAADREFRAAHTGAEAEYPVPRARETFEGTRVHLTEAQLKEYADSVADDNPFEFVLE